MPERKEEKLCTFLYNFEFYRNIIYLDQIHYNLRENQFSFEKKK